ncbi:HlyD family efflux transporter periplasmic adaptor subunit [Vibrio coralliirubri]|uniref:HlyD family efflux transporter periplasmic adaptor subunit n=1 Tax=Vibrio coralliirubri TaxID=1516159 RepID=UPI0022849FF1|nr:HlyD family efflux transporter periplasmic adaptor subunit [Vibrio coralliirubri]MCY9861137.1 HlyD family efflux transporter periplasmic adaptor subunit [Vibrio coralliirubri]
MAAGSKAFVALSIIALTGIGLSEIELVSPGRGFVDGNNNTLQVKSHGTGNVSQVYVSSGTLVKEGDRLISFDNHDIIFKSQSLIKNKSNLQSQLERTELDICATKLLMNTIEEGKVSIFSKLSLRCPASDAVMQDFSGIVKSYQWKAEDYFTYKLDIEALVKSKKNEAKMVQDTIEISKSKIRRLEKHGAVALSVEDAKRELNGMMQALNESQSSVTKLEIDVSSKKAAIFSELSDRLTRTTDRLHDIKDELALNDNELALAELKIKRSTIHSPIDGVVLSLEENVGVDYFLEESEAIMLLQKQNSDVVISAKFLAKYRGDISLGMTINIQPSLASAKTIYKGVITRISEDSFEDENKKDDSRYYKVTIKPSEAIPISEGTEVNVFAVGGSVSVFDWIKSVLIKNKTIFEPY